eukprot:764899-Hanusia_phi.AAC.5
MRPRPADEGSTCMSQHAGDKRHATAPRVHVHPPYDRHGRARHDRHDRHDRARHDRLQKFRRAANSIRGSAATRR